MVAAESDAIDASFEGPKRFTRSAFGRTYAKKQSLRVEIYIKDIQARYLSLEVAGGICTPKGKVLPVPGRRMNLDQYGNMRKGAVGKQAAKRNTFLGRPRGRDDLPAGIWQRAKTGYKLLVHFTD